MTAYQVAEEDNRYLRHYMLEELGIEGQQKLAAGRVLVVGVGGLGSPVLYYLVAAGVGHITIADGDIVEISNLQRQILHFTADLGIPKVYSGLAKLKALNPAVQIEAQQTIVNAENFHTLAASCDAVVDATDNFVAKFLLNDLCVTAGKPLIHAGIKEFTGQMMTILPGKSACYRCLFPDEPIAGTPEANARAGVLGAVAGTIGTLQATEVIKLLAGFGEPMINTLLRYDARLLHFHKVKVARRATCPACGEKG